MYALAAFALLVLYFVLSYRHLQRLGDGGYSHDNYGSSSSSRSDEGNQRSGRAGGWGKLAAGTALGILLGRRAKDRRHSRDRAEVVESRRPSGSYIEEEKYSQYGRDPGREGGGWGRRILELGAVGGVIALVRSFLDRRKDGQRNGNNRRYSDSHGGGDSVSEDSLARLEEGRPPPSRQHPLNQPLMPPQEPALNPGVSVPFNSAPISAPNQPLNPPLNRPLGHRRSQSSLHSGSYFTDEETNVGRHRTRDGIATLGAAGLLRNIFKNRREKKEQRRVEELRRREMEEERIARMNSQGRYTGDGYPGRGGRRGSLTASTNLTGSVDNRPRANPVGPPPLPAGAPPTGLTGVPTGATQPAGNYPGGTILGANNPVMTGVVDQPVSMPPIPPDPQGILHQETSGSEAYLSTGGRPHRRHRAGNGGLAAGVAAGASAASAPGEASRQQNRTSTGDDSVTSPPVSVKVKMHKDGRHVTLRRLPEEEAAAEREARRRERKGKNHRRGSASSLGGTDGSERWRRTEALEREQAEEIRKQNEVNAGQRADGLLPPPPPIPSSSISPGTGSVGSPGTYDGTGTEASADYVNNRRRRRAERAGRQARQENRVEFE